MNDNLSVDPKALFKIGYGLYLITSNDARKDNAFIANAVCHVTEKPLRVSVTINKLNYSHDIIKSSGILNVNCLNINTPFSVFKEYGYVSGRDVDKFKDKQVKRSTNGLVVLEDFANAFISLKVESYVDLGTHGMFICLVTESKARKNMSRGEDTPEIFGGWIWIGKRTN